MAPVGWVPPSPELRCIEPRCDRGRAEDGLRCILHASRLGQTQALPAGVEAGAPAVPAPEPLARLAEPPAPTQARRRDGLLVAGYGAIALGWVGIGLLFLGELAPGALLSIGGHAGALSLAIAAATRRRRQPAG